MRIRALRDGDDDAIAEIFRSTLVLGADLAAPPPDLDRYQALCLGWYLGAGRPDAAVVEGADGRVVGYALVCAAPDSHRRWTRRAGVRFAAGVALRWAARRYPPEAIRFHRLRLRDGWTLWRHSPRVLAGLGHAHLNLLPEARAGQAGRLLAAHVDGRVAHAGLPGWFGEINAAPGTRARALERLGGAVVHRAPNHTLTALVGQPIERLTVVRRTEDAERRPAA